MPLKLHKNNQKGLILEYDGQLYYKRGDGVDKVLWRCTFYSKGCRGICHTTNASKDGEILYISYILLYYSVSINGEII